MSPTQFLELVMRQDSPDPGVFKQLTIAKGHLKPWKQIHYTLSF